MISTLCCVYFGIKLSSFEKYFVKPLLSRNYCQKSIRIYFRDFHTVLCFGTKLSLFEKYFVKTSLAILANSCCEDNLCRFHQSTLCREQKLLQFGLKHFWKKFRESNVFTMEITKKLI